MYDASLACRGRQLSKASEEGERFVKLLAVYALGSFALLTAGMVATCYMRLKRTDHREVWGFFASASWPLHLRGVWTLLIMMVGVLPSMVIAVAVIFGSLMAAVEDWDVYVGIEYVLSNVLGLQDPLTQVTPQKPAGMVIDIVMSIWAMLLTTTITGISAGMCLMQDLADKVPNSAFGFLRYLLLYIPIGLLILACATGGLMAFVEGWSFGQGFVFMGGAIAGLSNSIANVQPQTAEGAFVESLCICFELILGGAIIGLVGSHPVVMKFIGLFEGETEVVDPDVDFADDSVNDVSLGAGKVNDFGKVSLDNTAGEAI